MLQRFDSAGLKVKKKCLLGADKVDFLGFTVDADGIPPAGYKIRAILVALVPKSTAVLQAFLGLLKFHHIFLPQKAAVVDPLYRLLDKEAPWTWGQR